MITMTNPYQIPSLDEVIELYVEQFDIQKLPKGIDPEVEAKKYFEKMAAKGWHDKDGQKIVDWVKWTKTAISYLKDANNPGKPKYITPKVVVHLFDCCWRTIEECDCALLLKKNVPDDPFDALSAALEESDPQEIAAFEWFTKNRRQHEMFISHEHDNNFFNSSQRGLARNYMSEDYEEYFVRMGPWIEFIARNGRARTELQHEMIKNYGEWLQLNHLPALINQCETDFDLFSNSITKHPSGLKQQEAEEGGDNSPHPGNGE